MTNERFNELPDLTPIRRISTGRTWIITRHIGDQSYVALGGATISGYARIEKNGRPFGPAKGVSPADFEEINVHA